ncbi:extracellular solute-binding protein [Cellulomonas xylanilytica]|uniref:Sugar ABC transporter substrate-binding protein n=1 Tax=Cellulomonas xylanilytica TaxID=233583 RepID=A0A510V7D0_9CELL|nr:extracellular solute-binding protein [Cellulomonas xylanilytica]GEK22777.1 sugar ABC transporter substrate-binding protein [Cellulomonas xylanilytica]
MRIARTGRSLAATVAATALLAACGGAGGDSGTSDGDPVTLTWWHNGIDEPLNTYFEKVALGFEADHPNVTIENVPVQNEELKARLADALTTGEFPDVFQQWGGGQMGEQVAAGALLDLTDDVTSELELIGGSAAGWQLEGRTYGLPFSMGVEGFWYNRALFEQAGITDPPIIQEDLDAAVVKLRAAGIVPIAVGAGDKWPAAHYWYNYALRACPPDTMAAAGASQDFSDPCFVKAGTDLEAFLATAPFQDGFLEAPAQQGDTSSAALLANGGAAMELMGHWNPGVMSGLAANGVGLGDDLGWFPFPMTAGGQGNANSALGGGDGFSCSADAPPECVDFLRYLLSVEVQTRYAETGAGLPVTMGSEAAVSDPNMSTLLTFRNNARYVQLWLDIAYGSTVGGALNDAVAAQFAGTGSARDVVDAMNAAGGS